MTRFLWSGCSDKPSICLARWGLLTKPKGWGGWGLKDLGEFGRALNAKNLWRCLFAPCLWQRVILAKYIRGWPISEWIRLSTYGKQNISNIWRALMNALPILKQWLLWKPGDGWSIRVGRDPILGLDGSYRLSDPLLNHLLEHRIYYLAQAASIVDESLFTKWIEAQEIQLEDLWHWNGLNIHTSFVILGAVYYLSEIPSTGAEIRNPALLLQLWLINLLLHLLPQIVFLFGSRRFGIGRFL